LSEAFVGQGTLAVLNEVKEMRRSAACVQMSGLGEGLSQCLNFVSNLRTICQIGQNKTENTGPVSFLGKARVDLAAQLFVVHLQALAFSRKANVRRHAQMPTLKHL
jgi:hypothetical protein